MGVGEHVTGNITDTGEQAGQVGYVVILQTSALIDRHTGMVAVNLRPRAIILKAYDLPDLHTVGRYITIPISHRNDYR